MYSLLPKPNYLSLVVKISVSYIHVSRQHAFNITEVLNMAGIRTRGIFLALGKNLDIILLHL